MVRSKTELADKIVRQMLEEKGAFDDVSGVTKTAKEMVGVKAEIEAKLDTYEIKGFPLSDETKAQIMTALEKYGK